MTSDYAYTNSYKIVINQDAQLPSKNVCISPLGSAGRPRRMLLRALVLLLVFLISLTWLLTLLRFVASLEQQLPGEHHKTNFRIPKTLPELKAFKKTLEQLKSAYPIPILTLYITVYLFIRSFIIPGSFVLNLLAGALYPLIPALLLVTVVSLLGDYLNYMVSRLLLSKLVSMFAHRQLNAFNHMLAAHKDNLLLYMTFMRALAIIPGWFINVASPLAGIKSQVFLASQVLGSVPVHLVLVNAGQTLNRLQTYQDIFTVANTLGLVACAMLPLATLALRYLLTRKKTKTASMSPATAV